MSGEGPMLGEIGAGRAQKLMTGRHGGWYAVDG
jgi:hypothetical protein